MKDFTDKQIAAIKKLKLAFKSCQKANLVACGINDNFHITKSTDYFRKRSREKSACEAMLDIATTDSQVNAAIYDSFYLDSGGA